MKKSQKSFMQSQNPYNPSRRMQPQSTPTENILSESSFSQKPQKTLILL